MQKIIIIAMWLLLFTVSTAIGQSSNDLNYHYHNNFGQLHNNNYRAAVSVSFDYKDVKLLREEYYTNGKLDRIAGPAVVYSSVEYTFGNRSLPIDWWSAKAYHKEWWLDGKKYTESEYNDELRKY